MLTRISRHLQSCVGRDLPLVIRYCSVNSWPEPQRRCNEIDGAKIEILVLRSNQKKASHTHAMNFRAFQRIWAAALGLAPDAIFAIGGAPTGACNSIRKPFQSCSAALTRLMLASWEILHDPSATLPDLASTGLRSPANGSSLLKEAAPRLTRVIATLFNPEMALTVSRYLTSIEAAAMALGVLAQRFDSLLR